METPMTHVTIRENDDAKMIMIYNIDVCKTRFLVYDLDLFGPWPALSRYKMFDQAMEKFLTLSEKNR